jgi:hypothetical protein
MILRSKAVAVIVFTVVFGGIGISALLGFWQTESSKTPIAFTTGEFTGFANPADIRGSYSFEDIERNFNVPTEVLSRAFNLESDSPEFQVKNLEAVFGELEDGGELGTDSIRLFVARYSGLPYEADPETRLLDLALVELETKLTSADLNLLQSRSIESLAYAKITAAMIQSIDFEDEEEDLEEKIVKGNTSFYDLMSWGLTKEDIELALGIPMGDSTQRIRDYCILEGLDFSIYKDKLQALLD